MDFCLTADGMAADSSRAASSNNVPREAALRWFDELSGPLRRYLVVTGALPPQADDAVQETFLRLYQQLCKHGEISNVRAWTFKVANNYIRDQRRNAYTRRTISLDEATQTVERFADSSAGAERAILSEEREQRLRKAIERLPARERECIVLRSSGLKYRQIAEVMEISLATVSNLAAKATERLAEDLL